MAHHPLVKKFKLTGNCLVDTKKTCKQWKEHWFISEYDLKFRLVIPDRRSREETLLKVQISTSQAREIINWANLQRVGDTLFKKAATWKIY